MSVSAPRGRVEGKRSVRRAAMRPVSPVNKNMGRGGSHRVASLSLSTPSPSVKSLFRVPCKAAPEVNQLSSIEKKKSGSEKVHIRWSFPILELSLECPRIQDTHLKPRMISPLWSPGSLHSWLWALPLVAPVTRRCGSWPWSEGRPVEWNKGETSSGYAPTPRWVTKRNDKTWLGNPHLSYDLRFWDDESQQIWCLLLRFNTVWLERGKMARNRELITVLAGFPPTVVMWSNVGNLSHESH